MMPVRFGCIPQYIITLVAPPAPPPAPPVTPAALAAVGATVLGLVTSGIASVGAAPVPSIDFVDHAPATYETAGALLVQLQLASPFPVAPCSVHWSTSDGTAIAGVNYTSSSGTASFTDTARTVTLSIPVIDDGVFRAGAALTFNIALTSPTGCTLTTPSVVAKVIDSNVRTTHVNLAGGLNISDQITFQSDGVLSNLVGYGPISPLQWLREAPIVGVGAGFDVRATLLSGENLPAHGQPFGAWVNLAANQTFGFNFPTGEGISQAFVKFEIRDHVTGVVLATMTWQFYVSVPSSGG